MYMKWSHSAALSPIEITERRDKLQLAESSLTESKQTRKYYPSSKQFQGPPTYTHQPSRCSAAKGAELDSAAAKQKGPFAAVWREAGAHII